MVGILPTVERRLATINKQIVTNEEGCWVWTGRLHGNGLYPTFIVNYRNTRVHRWMWEHINGPVPEGLELDHLCRNKRCVNPDHLEPVTHAENMHRWSESVYPREVREAIYRAYMAGEGSQYRLAERFGLTQPCISDIIRRERELDSL